jgi:hypothetical protein
MSEKLRRLEGLRKREGVQRESTCEKRERKRTGEGQWVGEEREREI